jgi:D-tyrosyl-tRNA(Tyr) deacylase
MIGVIQRVSSAEIWVEGRKVSGIQEGVVLLVGIALDDGPEDAAHLVQKTANLRIFADEQGHLNKSLLEINGQLLVVSQFTLLGDTRKGRRPSFTEAARPEYAEPLYRRIIQMFKERGITVQEGVFRALMEVKLTNYGPVTLILNTREKKISRD